MTDPNPQAAGCIVNSVAKAIDEGYVIQEGADQITAVLQNNLDTGLYDESTLPGGFFGFLRRVRKMGIEQHVLMLQHINSLYRP